MTENYRGSYQHALNFQQKIDIGQIFSIAYAHVKDRRTPFLSAIAWTAVLLLLALLLVAFLIQLLNIHSDGMTQQLLSTAVQVFVLAPCMGGLAFVALKTTLYEKPTREDFFQFFSNPWNIIGVSILTAIVSNIGLIFPLPVAIIWLIMAHIFFTLAVPMAAIYRAKPFAAFIGSLQIIGKQFSVFIKLHVIMFALYFILAIGVVVLSGASQAGQLGLFIAVAGGLGLLFILFTRLIPLQFFAIAEIYRILFNVPGFKSTVE